MLFHLFTPSAENEIAAGLKPAAIDSEADFGPRNFPNISVQAYYEPFWLILIFNPDLLLGQAILIDVSNYF